MKLIIKTLGEGPQVVAVIEDYTGQVPRAGDAIFHPPFEDDGTSDLSLYGNNVMTVKSVIWGIIARPPKLGPKDFTGRTAPMVEVWV